MNSTTGVLKVNDLRVWANHGWYEEERLIGGEYRIDVTMSVEISDAHTDLSDTVDYQDVVDLTNDIMRQTFKLIEDSCLAIFNALLTKLDKIKALEVTVTKLNIPINNLQSTSFTVKS